MTAILKHKDYQGSVSWEDGVLIIRILHIDDFVTDEVEVASKVNARFADLVDDYLETCAVVGKSPAVRSRAASTFAWRPTCIVAR